MKVLMINTLYAPYAVGGAERSVQLLAETLVALGHDVVVVTLHEDKKQQRETINGVKVVRLPLGNVYWPFSAALRPPWMKLLWHILDLHNPIMAKRVAEVVDEFSPDVVHTNNIAGFSTSVWSVANQRKIPLIHTARDYYLFHPNSTLYRSGRNQTPQQFSVRAWSLPKRRASRHVGYFVGISDYITQLHKNADFFPCAEAQRIYNTISPVKEVGRKSGDEVRIIGFLGRLTEEKGFDVFCKIAASRRHDPKLKFVAAGQATNSVTSIELRDRAIKLGIELLGQVELSKFLVEVSEVIMPIKWNEPFGRAVVECALSGIPVYTNKLGGVAEFFPFIPNLREIEDWEQCQTIEAEPLCEDVAAQFEPNIVANQYLSVFRAVMEGAVEHFG